MTRGAVERFAGRLWGGRLGPMGGLVSLLLLPPSAAFGAAVRARTLAYDRGWRASLPSSIPVLSVGNLAVGGTGKTPVVAWLAARARGMGARPAVVASGYGEDELALHRAWNPDIPVVRAPDRHEGIARAAADGASLALLDDAFQHRRAARDADVVLLAVEHPFPPRLLPRGPYREPLSALARADLLLLTRRTASAGAADDVEARLRRAHPSLPVARIQLRSGGWSTPEGAAAPRPRADVLAVTSIAGPEHFFEMVDDALPIRDVEGFAFPDHHPFDAGDVEEIARRAGGRTVVTTEKDAVKLLQFLDRLPPVRVLLLDVVVERGEDLVLETLLGLLRREGPAGSAAERPG